MSPLGILGHDGEEGSCQGGGVSLDSGEQSSSLGMCVQDPKANSLISPRLRKGSGYMYLNVRFGRLKMTDLVAIN